MPRSLVLILPQIIDCPVIERKNDLFGKSSAVFCIDEPIKLGAALAKIYLAKRFCILVKAQLVGL